MAILLILLLWAQAATAEPAAAADDPAATLKGLKEIYATTCGGTGILYHSYDDLCDGLRKQIRQYEVAADKRAAQPVPAKATASNVPAPASPPAETPPKP